MATKLGGTGRYYNQDILTYTEPDSSNIQYISRRFIPNFAHTPAIGVQQVQPGDRPDLLAYRAYNNPLSYYHIADYNLAINPFLLTTSPGHFVNIPPITT